MPHCRDGFSTSNTVTEPRFRRWIVDTDAGAEYLAQTARTSRSWPWVRSSTLAQRFLFAAGAVLFVRSPCPSMSILEEVKPPTGEPDAGDPHVRFGGRGSHKLSLPLFLIASVSRTPSDMAQPFPHEEAAAPLATGRINHFRRPAWQTWPRKCRNSRCEACLAPLGMAIRSESRSTAFAKG